MKFLNDFKNFFAILGVVSIIFWTCSAESTSDNSSNTNNPPAMTGGTYQIETYGANINYLHVLNTETGVYKRFHFSTNGWIEQIEFNTTFTH